MPVIADDNDQVDPLVTKRLVAGVAADERGASDDRPPLVLLHGLTFDRRMWRPALHELATVEPGRRSLALDLPGHGDSQSQASYDIDDLVDAVHRVVEEEDLRVPVIVGHSLAAVVATVYASRHPTSGVINVDQSLDIAPFATTLQSLGDKVRGPAFPELWAHFAASMHAEVLPAAGQELLRAISRPEQGLVLGYWREVLDEPVDETTKKAAQAMAAVGDSGAPYLVVAGADPDEAYLTWLRAMVPQAAFVVWPDSGHFPHLAHPHEFAEVLAASASWP